MFFYATLNINGHDIMKDNKDILHQIEQRIVPSPKGYQTTAGRPDKLLSGTQKERLTDAINQAFELLRVNYHHLFFSAYDEMDALDAAKRLWLENLSLYSPKTIITATHNVIKQSDYLPTISQLVRQCQQIDSGLIIPDVHTAYVEACTASSPKQNYPWTHPIIYFAGRNSNWFFLTSNPESIAFPVFKRHYQQLCQRLHSGESLPTIKPLVPKEISAEPLSKIENAKRMDMLKKSLRGDDI